MPNPTSGSAEARALGGSRPSWFNRAALKSAQQPPDDVLIIDDEEPRVRQPRDAVAIGLAMVGVAAVLALSTYAHGTTEGVQNDVQNISSALTRVLLLPVVLLETLVTLVIPVAVFIELTMRRMARQIIEAAAALALGLLLASIFMYAVNSLGSGELIRGLSVATRAGLIITVPGYIAGIAGLLTAAGPRQRRRTVTFSWNLVWFALAITLISGQVSLPGVVISLLLGRTAGLIVRYISGVSSERARGRALVEALRRANFEPISLIRVRDIADDSPAVESADIKLLEDPTAVALSRTSDTRVYAMAQLSGPRLDVVVLDGDRQVIGFLQRLWHSIRVRGIEGRSAISLRAVAERAALLTYAASAAGVRTPRLLGVAHAEDSMLLVLEHPEGAIPLNEVPSEAVSDATQRAMWRQLELAHTAGLAHRGITGDVVLVERPQESGRDMSLSPVVWITGWQAGDIASPAFSQLMDNAQLLATLALSVGAERAVMNAVDVLGAEKLAAVGPLLQGVVLPSATRIRMRAHKNLLTELRSALVLRLPEANVEPQQINRFSVKTVVTWILTVVAVAVVFTTINFEQVTAAASQSNPWWFVATFVLGLATWFGAAMTFIGFASVRLPVFKATLVQAAASFVALAAPAGIGPAALNLRMLTRRGVPTSLAVATVALVQVSGFIVTVLLLVLLSVVSGEGGALRALPSTSVIFSIIGLTMVGGVVFSVPVLRRWVLAKTTPTFKQVWPRLSELLSTPWRLMLGVLGNVVITLGYVFAFQTALLAFNVEASLIDLAVVYLVGNTVGSLAPTPGGLGAIEFALITGLTTTAGVPAAVATSAVVLFRFATYWARIPLGWFAMRFLTRRGDL
ncbi:lysylphosphatidylglycerol synthase transmembrane domain-containing protein [Jonesia quinghaiensis]|uniref:lysylphosphatidylglycerol synthase transmembrane domain-containing protein n=1 Tax=Jonesia quinghaiensis TaxID=262806 RepID=UPI000406087F|nr:lysylphosphatidylglycerol synthase transmembrane domain-containing protein [Jonesia quinghaiensis]